MIVLQAHQISFRYPSGPLLVENARLHVQAGECVAVTGPSGSGKSTLLHILSGIIPRSIQGEVSGEILLCGDNLSQLSLAETVRRVGVVFQDPEAQIFFPTVEGEIAFGLENLCLPEGDMERLISSSLEAVGMAEYRYRAVKDLSQGQKQLIALAAVLAMEPRLLILDEVFASLDESGTQVVQKVIEDYKHSGRAVLLVEHDPEQFSVVDRLYHLAGGRLREVVQ